MNIITGKKSPNYTKGRKGWIPDIIVCHISEGYETGVDWLCNPKSEASCHYFVAKSGKVYQLVDLKNSSWCNGNTTIDSNDKRHYSKASHPLVRQRKTSANYYTVTIEFEGFYNKTQGLLNDPQLDSAIKLIKHIKQEIKRLYGVNIKLDRDHIIGHYEINPITKPHCGNGKMQYDEIIKGVNLEGEEEMVKYNKIEELPYGQDVVKKLINRGLLKGINQQGDLGISEDMLRILVINDRAGLYQ